MIQSKISDFYGYPNTVGNLSYTKTQGFQRNNCSTGNTGSVVDYSKVYSVYGTQQDLDNTVAADSANFNAEGQIKANAEGTCSVSCPDIYDNINSTSVYFCEGSMANKRFFNNGLGVSKIGVVNEGVNSPFSTADKSNKKRVREAFIRNIDSDLQYNGYEFAATESLVFGVKGNDVWVHNKNIHTSCDLGSNQYSIPYNWINFKCFGASSSSGLPTGSIVVENSMKNQGGGLTGYGVQVSYVNSIGNAALLGSINRKTSDYKTISLFISVNLNRGIFVAAISRKQNGDSSGNIGVWYSDYLISPSNVSRKWVNILPWMYSENIDLIGVSSNPDNNEMLLVYKEGGGSSIKHMVLHNNGVRTTGGTTSQLYPQRPVANPTDKRTYLFKSDNSYLAYNWLNNTWSSV